MRPQCPLLFPLYYSKKSYTRNLQAQQSITYKTLITIEQYTCLVSALMQQPFDCPSDEVVYYRDSENTFDQLDFILNDFYRVDRMGSDFVKT
uniref:Uncharacterized protein n=1 Tax=Solanum lycopersicum TaxID=4081 RepID=A0A3Q7F1Q0_SOLLC